MNYDPDWIKVKTNLIILTIVVLLLFVLSLVYGCKVIERTEYVTVTDTLYNYNSDTIRIHQIDTVREVKNFYHTDTIRDVQTRIITLKESGDTIKEVVNNNLYHYIYQKDSTDKYQSKIDSLANKIQQIENEKATTTIEKETIKKKNSWWKYVSCVLATLLCLGGIYILWIKLKR